MASTAFSPSSSVLAQLHENTRLQTTLAEQKMRSERQKGSYEVLRAQHTQLTEDFRRLELSSSETQRKYIQSDQKLRDIIMKLSQERDMANDMVEQLRLQALTPQREALLREEISDTLATKYEMRLATMQREADGAKGKLVRVQYDSQFATTELNHQQEQHQRAMADMVERHRIEVERLSSQQNTSADQLFRETMDLKQRLLATQRENTQLKARTISLENEMEERRAVEAAAEARLLEATDNSDAMLLHIKAALKSTETSLEGAEKQNRNLEAAIQGMRSEQEQLRLHRRELEMQLSDRESKLENALRHQRSEVATLQRQSQQACSELDTKCSSLTAELRTWKCRADEHETAAKQAMRLVKSKEDELSLRLQAVREEEWKRLSVLEQEKLDVETRLSEADRRRREAEEQCSADTDTLRQQVQSLTDEKKQRSDGADKLREHISQLQDRISRLERERNSLRDAEKKYRDLQLQYRSLVGVEQELQASASQLQAAMDVQQQQLDSARLELQGREQDHERQMEEQRLSHQKQDAHIQGRINELQALNSDLQAKYQKTMSKAKKIKHQGSSRVQELQEDIELLQAKQMHHEQEKEHLQNRMQSEIDSLKYRLRELNRRHGEFNFLLHGMSHHDKSTMPNVPPAVAATLRIPSTSESDDKGPSAKTHERDISSVHRRLAHLSAPSKTTAVSDVREQPSLGLGGTSTSIASRHGIAGKRTPTKIKRSATTGARQSTLSFSSSDEGSASSHADSAMDTDNDGDEH